MNFGRNKQQSQPAPSSQPSQAPTPPTRPNSFPPPYVGPPAQAPHLQQNQQNSRPQSPMPPHAPYGPTQVGGNIPPPQIPPQMGPPAGYGQPPGYPQQHRPQMGHQQQQQMVRPGVQEVDGGGRSKAQLIVGIDFVSCGGDRGLGLRGLTGGTGYNVLRCGICVCDGSGSEGGYHHRVAWRGESNQEQGMFSALRSGTRLTGVLDPNSALLRPVSKGCGMGS